jgi:hypothetical protein
MQGVAAPNDRAFGWHQVRDLLMKSRRKKPAQEPAAP